MDMDISNAAISTAAGRSKKFFDYTKEASDYLISLNLPSDKHDKLVELLVKQLTTAEHDAFIYGVTMTAQLTSSLKSDELH